MPADALVTYLRAQAVEFLRALRLHREAGTQSAAPCGPDAEGPAGAALALRRAARRISGTLHTYQPLLDADWAEAVRPELAWLSGTLSREHACASKLERLLTTLHRLSGTPALPGPAAPAGRAATVSAPASGPAGTAAVPLARTAFPDRGQLTVGAARAGALLDRRLTLARTRAHSAALQALGSSRFHALADAVALLASEVPLRAGAAGADLRAPAAAAEDRLTDAVTALPLAAAGHPYNAQALDQGLSPDTAPHPQDAPWLQVRLLLRLHRYAREVLLGPGGTDPDAAWLGAAGQALDRHRDAAEAAAEAAQAARTPRIAPATAYALGVLHAAQRHEVEAARYAFRHGRQRATTVTPR